MVDDYITTNIVLGKPSKSRWNPSFIVKQILFKIEVVTSVSFNTQTVRVLLNCHPAGEMGGNVHRMLTTEKELSKIEDDLAKS